MLFAKALFWASPAATDIGNTFVVCIFLPKIVHRCDTVVKYYKTGVLTLAPPQGPGAGGAKKWIAGGVPATSVSAKDAGKVIGDENHIGYVTATGIIHSSSSKNEVVEVPHSSAKYIWPNGFLLENKREDL